jgi:hypothetical protein
MADEPPRLTADECRKYAGQCLELATQSTADEGTRRMFQQMAESWLIIAADIEQRKSR